MISYQCRGAQEKDSKMIMILQHGRHVHGKINHTDKRAYTIEKQKQRGGKQTATNQKPRPARQRRHPLLRLRPPPARPSAQQKECPPAHRHSTCIRLNTWNLARTVGLSRGGFTLKEGIGSLRSWLSRRCETAILFSHPVNFLAWRSRRRAVHVWHIVHGRTPASTWCVAAAPIAPPIRRRIVRSRLHVSAVHWPATIRRAGRHWSVRLRILYRCWARGIRRGVTGVRRGIVGHPSPASRRGIQTRVISALHLPGFQAELVCLLRILLLGFEFVPQQHVFFLEKRNRPRYICPEVAASRSEDKNARGPGRASKQGRRTRQSCTPDARKNADRR
jgi:hypothetical protein